MPLAYAGEGFLASGQAQTATILLRALSHPSTPTRSCDIGLGLFDSGQFPEGFQRLTSRAGHAGWQWWPQPKAGPHTPVVASALDEPLRVEFPHESYWTLQHCCSNTVT